MSVLGGVLMVVGVAGLFVGFVFPKRVRHISSVSLWLIIFAVLLCAGLAIQATAEGWDIQDDAPARSTFNS
jgi:hypothetical protein